MTPEIIAEYTAKISKGYSVIDGFCGSGGNVIQFSKYGSKVYAIDIDDKKLDICKNNCKVYNCDDNISFIHCDFLKIDNYSNEKVYADYIFLSPPWGGIEYKNSDVYSIKKLMTPSIYDIIKMCLKVSKYIMFYVPRTLLLEELFNIISEITGNDRLFFDVHILKSANKIKALLIIFGYNIKDKILESDIEEYIRLNYEPYKISERNLEILLTISKLIGCYKFFQNEYDYRNYLIHEYNESNLDIGNEVIKYFFNKILTEQEKIKLKSLNNLFNPKVFHYKKATSIDKESIKNTRINIYKSYSNQIIFSSTTPLNSTNSSISSNKSNNGKHTWVLEEANEISIQFLSDNSM